MASITLDENTYISSCFSDNQKKTRMNFFMCSKCDMICAETIPLPDSSFCEYNHKKTQKLQAKRIYCIACDDEYTEARRNYGLIKHWLCCAFPCS